MKKKDSLHVFQCVVASLFLSTTLSAHAAEPYHWEITFADSDQDAEAVSLALEEASIYVYNIPKEMEPVFLDGYQMLGELGEIADRSEIIFARAYYAKASGLSEEAERLYRELVRREPDNRWALNGLGYLLADLPGRQDEALEILARAEAVAPNDFAIIDSIAWALYRQGRFEAAAARMDEALALMSEDNYSGEVYAHAGEIKWAMGLKEEAAEVWFEGWKNTYGLSRDLKSTMEYYGQETPELDWDLIDAQRSPRAYALIVAESLAEEEGSAVAYAYLSAFGVLYDLSDELLERMAELAYDAEMLDEAATHYRALIKLDPEDPWLYNSLGYMLADSNRDVPEAVELLRQGLGIDPDNPYLLDSYGWALYRSGDLQSALFAIERSLGSDILELDPYSGIEVLAHHGEILWEMGRKEEAMEAWRRGWEIADYHPVLIETLRRYGAEQ